MAVHPVATVLLRLRTPPGTTRTGRELVNTIGVYANQVQVLTLRNAELEDQLHQHAGRDVSMILVGPAHAVTRQYVDPVIDLAGE